MAFKGDYKSNAAYSAGDTVRYTDGVFYHMHKVAPTGTPPTDTLYWNREDQVLAWAMRAIMDHMEAVGGLTKSDLANNLTTTATGKALDARQGKALKALIPENITESAIVLKSSTASSTKSFTITVDDDGELTATEVVAAGGET